MSNEDEVHGWADSAERASRAAGLKPWREACLEIMAEIKRQRPVYIQSPPPGPLRWSRLQEENWSDGARWTPRGCSYLKAQIWAIIGPIEWEIV